MELYIVRHGQTDGNVNKIMDGIRDIDLNAAGVLQAQETKEQLKNVKFDLIVCSPLIRTRHTMEIINEGRFPVIFDDRIKERDCGEFTGKPFTALDRELYWNYYDTTKYERAEALPVFFKRVYDFLNEIKEKFKDMKVLLVTHRGVTNVISCYFNEVPEDGDLEKLGMKNCEVKIYSL